MTPLPTIGETPDRAERCETCKWWNPSSRSKPNVLAAMSESMREVLELLPLGFCHRYPPQLTFQPPSDNHDEDFDSRFPDSQPDDFCGEWSARPVMPHAAP